MSQISNNSEIDRFTDVSSQMLIDLLSASDDMMEGILRGDRQATLNTMVRHVYDLLKAECCSVFLVSTQLPNELVLGARYGDKEKYDFRPYRTRIQSVPHAGLTGHIADTGNVVRLNAEELSSSQYIAAKSHDHLLSNKLLSVLGVPLKDRKGNLLGLLKIDNKKGLDGALAQSIFFSKTDELVARILANKIAIVLKNLRTTEILDELMQSMTSAHDSEEILGNILEKGLILLHADRGDLAIWNEEACNLILGLKYGSSRLEMNAPLPEKSIMREVWETGRARLIPDIRECPDYYCCDRRTLSEIVVRLGWQDRNVGVLNAESFQINGFDNHDLRLLDVLGRYATTAYQMVGKVTRVIGMVSKLGRFSPCREIFLDILRGLRDIYKLDAGVIYIANPNTHVLQCEAVMGCEDLTIDAHEISYRFEDTALTTKVFREGKGYFSACPSEDSNVSQEGINAFKIKSPIVGIPLISKEKKLGTLVAWSRQNLSVPTEQHIVELEPFARLAASQIDISASERQRTRALEAVQDILRVMQTELSSEKILQLIMQGVRAIGFDRVRVYRFDMENRSFVCIDSLGMPEDFQEYTIFLDKRPYARCIAENALENPRAHVYDPSKMGVDDDAKPLGRPPDLPWAVVPLVIGRRLYGQIAADNKFTRRDITADCLEYLTLLGALAAQAIANAEILKLLSGLRLSLEPGRYHKTESESTQLHRYLVYLTCGQTLGFCRAFFLQFQEGQRFFQYTQGLGSTSSKRQRKVFRKLRERRLEQLIGHMEELNDSQLDNAMNGFKISAKDSTISALLKQRSAKIVTCTAGFRTSNWIQDLVSRLGPCTVIVAPVVAEKKIFGLIIVDRQWQDREINEADTAAVITFTRLMSANMVIGESERQREAVLQSICLTLGRMQIEQSVEANLKLLLNAVREIGFDRARIFNFNENAQCFVGMASMGSPPLEHFRGYEIHLDRNPYAKDTADTCLTNPAARQYDAGLFGPDPDAKDLGKSGDLPWAVVPLVIAGKLHGQIVADNSHSRKEITSDTLAYLTLLGALAAHVIANSQTIDMLRASKLKDEFLQRMAHIFGTTTSAMQMLVKNIKDGIVNSERVVNDYIPVIARINERFVGLAQNLIDFAALREDTKMNIESVDFVTLITNSVKLKEAEAQVRGIQLDTEFPVQKLAWRLDPIRVANAIEGLIDNAIKFSPSEGHVQISLNVNEEVVMITIRDKGQGIPDKDLPLVFETFYRGSNAEDANVEGIGLGLAIVAQTMKLHGGRVEVHNHPEGGAEFILAFPQLQDKDNENKEA